MVLTSPGKSWNLKSPEKAWNFAEILEKPWNFFVVKQSERGISK